MIKNKIHRNVDLQAFNTMAVPSTCRYFVAAENVDDIRASLQWAQEKNVPVVVLGGGSNCLLPAFIEGLVVQPKLTGKTCISNKSGEVLIKAAAGENWHNLVMHCLEQGYYGLENLALIPGLVGAAPIQNIGAYGVELKDIFYSLEALDRKTGELIEFALDKCKFDYRESIFKGELKNSFIIASVTLRLHTNANCVKAHYPALMAELENRNIQTPSALDVANAVIAVRSSKLPNPDVIPNAGSFFKNPVVTAAQAEKLKAQYPSMPLYPAGEGQQKLAAGWLIEQAGWKGKALFDVHVHSKQALVITNPSRVERENILRLANKIAKDVLDIFGVVLEKEPSVV